MDYSQVNVSPGSVFSPMHAHMRTPTLGGSFPAPDGFRALLTDDGSRRTLWKSLELSSCAASSFWALCPADSSPTESPPLSTQSVGDTLGPRLGFSSCPAAGAWEGPSPGPLPAV